MSTKKLIQFLKLALFLTTLAQASTASAIMCSEAFKSAPITAPALGSQEHFTKLFDEIFDHLSVSERRHVQEEFMSTLRKQIEVSKARGVFRHPDRNRLWELNSFEIVSYPDQVSVAGKKGDLNSLKKALEALGRHFNKHQVRFNMATHILPPFKSPMIDNGYDVSHLTDVRPELGGLPAMKSLTSLGKKINNRGTNYKFVLDIIANHISDESPQFQAALRGDPKALNMFIYTFEKPQQEILNINGAPWVSYKIKNPDGTQTQQLNRLIFPDFAKSHFREVTMADGRKAYFFHYFYPRQMDWNWKNPAVLKEYLETMNFWINSVGIDLFRLDAIPFLEKSKESHPKTLAVVELMKTYVDMVAPHVRFRTESNQPVEVLNQFLGDSITAPHPVTGEYRTTNQRSTGAYNFPLLSKSWASLLSGDKSFVTEGLQNSQKVSESSVLTPMQRTHDELTLEEATPTERQIIRKHLLLDQKRGERFRGDSDAEALGVSGRMAEFLGFHPDRIRLAHALIFAQKGMPSVQIADMFGLGNDLAFARESAKKAGVHDSRQINRGPIDLEVIEAGGLSNYQRRVFNDFSQLVRARFSSQAIQYGSLRILDNNSKNVVSFLREHGTEKVAVLLNLDSSRQKVRISDKELKLMGQNQVLDLIQDKSVNIRGTLNGFELTLEPYQTIWLRLSE